MLEELARQGIMRADRVADEGLMAAIVLEYNNNVDTRVLGIRIDE